MENKTKKASYSIDEKVLKEFNELARKKAYNKSQLITRLMKHFMEKVEKEKKEL